MTTLALHSGAATERLARRRHFLMCPPTYFDVAYAINPWMDPSVPVDRALAAAQWTALVDTYRAHGHRVDLLEPVPGLPDMVYAANGATVVDGRVLRARFAHRQRRAEAAHHESWHLAHHLAHNDVAGSTGVRAGRAANEAEGDFAVLSSRVLAGYGFRTTRAAHRELAGLTGRPVLGLELVNPRFYHLDVALTVLDDEADHIAYYPAAFSRSSQRLLAQLFPDALIADATDAAVLGLNCVSDGRHVFVPAGADHLTRLLDGSGYQPVPIDLSELVKGGGSVKCCTQEIRAAVPSTSVQPEAGAHP
ncbi:MAG TPA: arginine deiminase-related protein [Propionibacteriaceae bacterium]